MRAIVCGQAEVLGDGCPGCGGWLHCEVRGGYAGPKGWRFCSEECAADQEEYVAPAVRVRGGLHTRGLPTAEMRQEYADYLDSIEAGAGKEGSS
jgi:hypothetical protein